MRLRVTCGDVADGTIPEADLQVVFRSARLTIEASRDVQRLPGPVDTPAFIAGMVVGVRARNGSLVPLGGAAHLGELVHRHGPEESRQTLEGRFLAAVVRPGGTCEVFSDRFGKRDLYIQRLGDTVVAASALELLPVASRHDGFDPVAIAHTLVVYGWRPAKKHTFYAGVSRLGVGETLRLGKDVVVDPPAFQPLPSAPYTERDLHRYADLLIDAVDARSSRSGNVVYLSSGWDSTAILACLVHIHGARKVRGVIGRMRYSERSGVINKFEISRAADVAAFHDVPLEIVDIDYRSGGPEVLESLAPTLRSQQLASMTALSHGLLAAHVARTTTGDESVFAGEISDGAHNLGFSQYTTIFHPVLEFREYSDKMASYLFGPTFLSALADGSYASDPVYRLLRDRCTGVDFDEWTEGPASQHALTLFASFFLRGNRLPFWPLRASRLLTAEGQRLYSQAMETTYLARAAAEATPHTLYSWYLWLYNSFHWQGSTVGTLAATAEAHGLRIALPFWDSRIQDFLSAMPESWGRGLDLNPTKYPLKWMLKHRVRYPMHLQVGPHSYLYDVDHAFNLSFEVLYHSSFAAYFREKLRPRAYHSLLPSHVIDVDRVDRLVTQYLAGTELTGADLNDLVSICWLSAVGWYGG